MASDQSAKLSAIVASLEHLTGPSRGTVTWLGGSAVDISIGAGRHVHISEVRPGEPQDDLATRLHLAGNSYEIEAPEGRSVWVNGVRVAAKRLDHGDMIEFGESGPLSRFRLHDGKGPFRKTIPDILTDSVSYLRVSRQPPAARAYRAFCSLLRQLTFETTILFRIAVVIAISALVTFAYQQSRLNIRLQERIERGVVQIDSVTMALSRAREEALRPSDLAAMREELGRRLTSNVERLEMLEQRSRAVGRVIAESMPSVAFLQGSYGFRDRTNGQMLRHMVNEAGIPLISPIGQPLLSLGGDGPVAEINFLGTGFFVGDSGALITNRHVALPWERDSEIQVPTFENLEPAITKFIVYLPGSPDAVPVELLLASETSDLAVLKPAGDFRMIPRLKLSAEPPTPGDEVIVMGYPTGLRSMLAQSGKAFVEQLQETENTGFWSVAERLAEEGYIAPLASRGIVGQVTQSTIVYDAETTYGGSGGPVLDIDGDVVAVNVAILPEYGGSNLGIPAAKVRLLLEQAGLR